eukprot:s723_g15.t2
MNVTKVETQEWSGQAAQNASAALQLLCSADVDQIHVTACLHRMASVSAHSGKPRPDEVQELLSYMEPQSLTAEMLVNYVDAFSVRRFIAGHWRSCRRPKVSTSRTFASSCCSLPWSAGWNSLRDTCPICFGRRRTAAKRPSRG